jgi:hypothetical protein
MANIRVATVEQPKKTDGRKQPQEEEENNKKQRQTNKRGKEKKV